MHHTSIHPTNPWKPEPEIKILHQVDRQVSELSAVYLAFQEKDAQTSSRKKWTMGIYLYKQLKFY